jgi:hypothetical protein
MKPETFAHRVGYQMIKLVKGRELFPQAGKFAVHAKPHPPAARDVEPPDAFGKGSGAYLDDETGTLLGPYLQIKPAEISPLGRLPDRPIGNRVRRIGKIESPAGLRIDRAIGFRL